MLEILCKLISCYQLGTTYPHRAVLATLALGFIKCLLEIPAAEWVLLLEKVKDAHRKQ